MMSPDEFDAVLERLVTVLRLPYMAEFEELSIVVKHSNEQAAVYLSCDNGKAEHCIYRPTENSWAKADECSFRLYELLGTGPVMQHRSDKLM